jgi:hypothetical protein
LIYIQDFDALFERVTLATNVDALFYGIVFSSCFEVYVSGDGSEAEPRGFIA